MRATLHDHAPNTYYGQWLAKKAGKHAAKPGAIAHNELVASPGVAPFDLPEARFPGESLAGALGIFCRPKEKSARQATSGSSDDHAAHRFYPMQQRSRIAASDHTAREPHHAPHPSVPLRARRLSPPPVRQDDRLVPGGVRLQGAVPESRFGLPDLRRRASSRGV